MFGPFIRSITRHWSPGGAAGRLTVFTFHRVSNVVGILDEHTPDQREFAKQLQWIKNQFNVVPLREAMQAIGTPNLPERAAAITIDDGYKDNVDYALPVIQAEKLHATFFIATCCLENKYMFHDRLSNALLLTQKQSIALPNQGLDLIDLSSKVHKITALRQLIKKAKYDNLIHREEFVSNVEHELGVTASGPSMMSRDDVLRLAKAGMEIGGHTRNHPILRLLPDELALQEIALGANDLKDITGYQPKLFAFPNGRPGEDFEPRHSDMVRQAGFEYAFTTERGVVNASSNPFALPRFATWPGSKLMYQLRLVKNLSNGNY
jgi:peptidoglycan/xylan/chitin deacetylase (PgdA/CDA1 family)